MNRVRHISGKARFRVSTSRSGTVLMECVLVLPLLTLLIFSIVQFALIWYAQIMTHYAAYNAARAALVYHPGEYREVDEKKRVLPTFQKKSGVCWEAACRTLAWVSSSPDGGGTGFGIPGWYAQIPNSSHIERQVRVAQGETESFEMTNAPVVRVTIEFDCPLHVPVIGHMLAYFDKMEETSPSTYEIWGWKPDTAGEAELKGRVHDAMKTDFITLRATAILPKLWKTTRFARKMEASSFAEQYERTLLQFDDIPTGLARGNP